MIQLLLGKAGTGKTKKMIELANKEVSSIKGQLVYIEASNKHMYDLHRNIRLISTKDFNISTLNSFYGFLCGIISQNYDIETMYINGIGKITPNLNENIGEFLNELEKISLKYEVNLIISLSTEDENLLSKVKKYSVLENVFAPA